ncbi:PRC-barrel domain-containing protein [Streptomyces aculeolatus]|uniref:PRC-barrel domain-containing protein n=1 Tax=Streptomyces aculeolatus TaxID=270689 RepID=UPI00036261FA|nr:PRC-barrel domain-containing protein [Streptomyces aculeolatus]
MFEAHDIREWRGHPVRGADGGKIGEMEAVYVDTRTDVPSFATVKAGVPGRKRLVFVPLDGASVSPGYVTVAYDKGQVKGAPSIGTDGELAFEEEPAVYSHYELDYEPGAAGERRLARR